MSASERLTILPAEYRDRHDRLRALCEQQGWPGLAIVGRGGGTLDRYGELLWATGHYQPYCYLPDRPPLWSGRSHALLTMPVDGEPTLLVSAPEHDPEVAIADVRTAPDFRIAAAELLTRLGGGGLVGLDSLPASLARGLPLERFAEADAAVQRLRRRKSAKEQALIRRACAIGVEAVGALVAAARPGAREQDAAGAAAEVVYGHGAEISLLALAAGDRSDRYVGRSLPGYRPERALIAGEVARLDLVLHYEGYGCDFGRSWVVGGAGENPAAERLIAELTEALAAAAAAARPGAVAADIAAAGAAALPTDVTAAYPPHWGHGLGLGWEGPMLLPDNDEPIEEGCALAIETAISRDGIVVAAEDDVLVTAGGPEILTRLALA